MRRREYWRENVAVSSLLLVAFRNGERAVGRRLFPCVYFHSARLPVAKEDRGSKGRICTLSRICTLPSSPKLLRTLFAVLARPEWRVNGGIPRSWDTYTEHKRRIEMEKSGEKRDEEVAQFPDPRIRSAPRDRSSLQNLRNCYARGCYYATPTQTPVVG